MERYGSLDDETDGEVVFQPRGAQIEALYALKKQPIGRIGEGIDLRRQVLKNISGCV